VKSFLHLLNMDISFHYSSSQKARLFSLYKAQQFVEKNIKISLNMFIPLTFDILFSVGYLHFYCGPEFVLTFLSTIGLYVLFTAKSSFKRKPFIMMQKSLDKRADSVMNEALANIYNVKYFNSEKREVEKYSNLLEVNIFYCLSFYLIRFSYKFLFKHNFIPLEIHRL
jgi:ATP-binding cassette subfamily B (MDR/TAP) protein 7